MTVYILRVASRYEERLVGIFSSSEEALIFFGENFQPRPDGVAITADTYNCYVDAYEVDTRDCTCEM